MAPAQISIRGRTEAECEWVSAHVHVPLSTSPRNRGAGSICRVVSLVLPREKALGLAHVQASARGMKHKRGLARFFLR